MAMVPVAQAATGLFCTPRKFQFMVTPAVAALHIDMTVANDVRRFSGPSGDRFVVVTCRLGGGGARVPLALTDVRIDVALVDGMGRIEILQNAYAA